MARSGGIPRDRPCPCSIREFVPRIVPVTVSYSHGARAKRDLEPACLDSRCSVTRRSVLRFPEGFDASGLVSQEVSSASKASNNGLDWCESGKHGRFPERCGKPSRL